jgi:hypothetical protein
VYSLQRVKFHAYISSSSSRKCLEDINLSKVPSVVEQTKKQIDHVTWQTRIAVFAKPLKRLECRTMRVSKNRKIESKQILLSLYHHHHLLLLFPNRPTKETYHSNPKHHHASDGHLLSIPSCHSWPQTDVAHVPTAASTRKKADIVENHPTPMASITGKQAAEPPAANR